MCKRLCCMVILAGYSALTSPLPMSAQDMVVSKIQPVNLKGDDVIKVKADPSRGFNYPFYLFLLQTIDKNLTHYLYVETNNTGKTSDDFNVHDQGALRLVKDSYANRMARRLHVPLLVPTFPRPKSDWQCYTRRLAGYRSGSQCNGVPYRNQRYPTEDRLSYPSRAK